MPEGGIALVVDPSFPIATSENYQERQQYCLSLRCERAEDACDFELTIGIMYTSLDSGMIQKSG